MQITEHTRNISFSKEVEQLMFLRCFVLWILWSVYRISHLQPRQLMSMRTCSVKSSSSQTTSNLKMRHHTDGSRGVRCIFNIWCEHISLGGLVVGDCRIDIGLCRAYLWNLKGDLWWNVRDLLPKLTIQFQNPWCYQISMAVLKPWWPARYIEKWYIIVCTVYWFSMI